MKKIFVIGDVHGCLHTLEKMLSYWEKNTEQLIFVGDLIDRGNFSPETVSLVKKLVKKEDAVCLMGNHEFACAKTILDLETTSWFGNMGAEVNGIIAQYNKNGFSLKKDAKWFADLALTWQNEKFIISHAGISVASKNPFDKNNKESVLWTRSKLKVFGNKIQIHGHTPHFNNPLFNKETKSWNIDSACVYDYFFTGLKFKTSGEFLEKIIVKTNKKDIPRKYSLDE